MKPTQPDGPHPVVVQRKVEFLLDGDRLGDRHDLVPERDDVLVELDESGVAGPLLVLEAGSASMLSNFSSAALRASSSVGSPPSILVCKLTSNRPVHRVAKRRVVVRRVRAELEVPLAGLLRAGGEVAKPGRENVCSYLPSGSWVLGT
jgi:hypothetical protein